MPYATLDALPAVILVQQKGRDRLHMVFPDRDLGTVRYLATLGLLLGLVGVGTPIYLGVQFGIWQFLFDVVPLSVILLLRSLLTLRVNHVEIHLAPGGFLAVECAGRTRLTTTIDLDKVRTFTVARPSFRVRFKSALSPHMMVGSAIRVRDFEKNDTFIAAGYPADWLLPVAQTMAEAAREFIGEPPLPEAGSPSGEFVVTATPPLARPLWDKPVIARAQLHQADHLAIVILAPSRRWFAHLGRLCYAVFMLLVIAFIGLIAWNARPAAGGVTVRVIDVIIAAGALYGWNRMNRKTVLTATPDGLVVATRGGLGWTREQHFPGDRIQSLYCKASSRNFKLIKEQERPTALILEAADDKPRRLLVGDAPEIQWIATHLRHALNLQQSCFRTSRK